MDVGHDDTVRRLTGEHGSWFLDDARLEQGRLSGRLHPFERLFSPVRINGVTLANRVGMAPLGNLSAAEETGRPSERMVRYFAERARGGAGLLISGLVPVSQRVDPSVTEPGGLSYFPRIDRSRSVFTGWRNIASACHAYGARFFVQLSAGMGRVGSPECLLTKHRPPVSASWNPNYYMPQVPCRPLLDHECRRIVKAAGQAAADARAMQIDGVHVHGHEGYLLDQLTNPAFNRRRHGRYADWQAFGLELVREIRRRTADDYPIMYRIDLSAALAETYGERMRTVSSLRRFTPERTVAMTLDYMVNLVAAGVDAFDVDLGCYDNWWLPHPPTSMPPGCYVEAARVAREHLRARDVRSNAGLDVPVAAVGKLGNPDLCEQVLRDEACDFVLLGRPLLADPDWPAKAYAGRVADIVPCIGDQEGCLNELTEGGHLQCSVNPRAGFEDVYERDLPPAESPRRVAVVGAGPAGVACACAAARRGHEVVVFEARDRPGGMLVPGSVPRSKLDVANYLRYLERQLEHAAAEHGVDVRLGCAATADLLAGGAFEAVVTCTGGEPLQPRLAGAGGPNVVTAVGLLREPALAAGAARVVVIGGGAVGCEVAFWLAAEHGRQVAVVEQLPYLMKGDCTANRGYLLHHLEELGVRLLNCARVTAIDGAGVHVLRNLGARVPDPYCTWSPLLPDNLENPLARRMDLREAGQRLDADLVVLATGLAPAAGLYRECLARHVAPQVFNIGDSFAVGRVLDAVRAGFTLGRTL